MSELVKKEKVNLFSISKQKWKFVVMFCVNIISIPILYVMLNEDAFTSAYSLKPLTIFKVFMIFSFFVAFPVNAFLLRCPKCKAAMIWYIIRKKDQRELGRLLKKTISEGCPVCEVNYSDMLKEKQKNER